MTCRGSKISNAPENDTFSASFIHLELRRAGREGGDYRIINKIMCSLEGSEKEAFKKWPRACQINLLSTWDVTTHHDLPS